jgi:hypothetical protein
MPNRRIPSRALSHRNYQANRYTLPPQYEIDNEPLAFADLDCQALASCREAPFYVHKNAAPIEASTFFQPLETRRHLAQKVFDFFYPGGFVSKSPPRDEGR